MAQKHSLFLHTKTSSAQPLDVRVPLLGDRAVQPDARAEYRGAGAAVRAGWTREREREREGSGFFFGRFVRPSTSRRRNPPPDPDLSSHVFLPLCILSRSPRTSNHSPSRLEDLGHGVGASLLELLCWRERGGKRTPTALDALKFAHSSLWRALFGRQAKDLEQSNTVSGSVSFSLFRFRFFLSFYREETEQAGEDGERGVDRKERERGRPRSEKKRGAEKGKKRKKARNSKQLGPKKLKKNRPRTST